MTNKPSIVRRAGGIQGSNPRYRRTKNISSRRKPARDPHTTQPRRRRRENPSRCNEVVQISIKPDDPKYGNIFSPFPLLKSGPLHIYPIDPSILWGMGRTDRQRFLRYLSQENAPVPGQNVLQRIFIKKEEDLATLMIISLSRLGGCDDLAAELLALSPPMVLRNVHENFCKLPYLHSGMLVTLVHVTARNVNITRRQTTRTTGDSREFRKPATVRAVIDIVASLLQSYDPTANGHHADAVKQSAERHTESLKRLADEPNAKDRGVQMGIILHAVKKLRDLLRDSEGRNTRFIVFGLRVAVGLMGMVPIGGPVCAGVLPVIENMMATSVEKKREEVDMAVVRINDICVRFTREAGNRSGEDSEDHKSFCEGLRFVEDHVL